MNRKANGFGLYWIVIVVLLGIVVPAAAQEATPVPEVEHPQSGHRYNRRYAHSAKR